MEDVTLYRMEANRAIASSYLKLTSFFLRDQSKECQTLEELWIQAGSLICNLLQCQDSEISTSRKFYEALLRKFRYINVSLATELNAEEAANGDNLEICKFYALFLEHLRKEQGDVLKNVLEKLDDVPGFDCQAMVKTFAFFDSIYANDSADDWWSILAEKVSDVTGFTTPVPRRHRNSSMFTTPTASLRKVRSVVSTARRSPIVEAIDSPTMKFMRCDRELKELKKKLVDTESKLDEAENENSSLLSENRELKSKLVDVRSNFSADRGTIEGLEENNKKLKEALDAKTLQVENLNRSVEEAGQSMRNLLRRMEESDAEKIAAEEKLVTLEESKSSLMKQLMDARQNNEADYKKWQTSTAELSSNLAHYQKAFDELSMEMTEIRSSEKEANIENERLKESMNQMETLNVRLESAKNHLEEELRKNREQFDEMLKKEKNDREIALAHRDGLLTYANKTIERISAELESERAERSSLKDALDSLRQVTGQKHLDDVQSTEALANARSSFQLAQSKIETLEISVQSKERMIATLKSQLDQQQELMTTEYALQEKFVAQFHKEKECLSKQLAETEEKNARMSDEFAKKSSELEAENVRLTTEVNVAKFLREDLENAEKLNAKLEVEKADLEEEIDEMRSRLHRVDKSSIVLDDFEKNDIYEMLMNAPTYTPEMFGIKPRQTIASGLEFNTPCSSARVSLVPDSASSKLTSTYRDSMRSYNSQKVQFLEEEPSENTPSTDEVTKKKNRRKSMASLTSVFKKKN